MGNGNGNNSNLCYRSSDCCYCIQGCAFKQSVSIINLRSFCCGSQSYSHSWKHHCKCYNCLFRVSNIFNPYKLYRQFHSMAIRNDSKRYLHKHYRSQCKYLHYGQFDLKFFLVLQSSCEQWCLYSNGYAIDSYRNCCQCTLCGRFSVRSLW